MPKKMFDTPKQVDVYPGDRETSQVYMLPVTGELKKAMNEHAEHHFPDGKMNDYTAQSQVDLKRWANKR